MLPQPSSGVVLGQEDTFLDGTVQGWIDPADNTSNIGTGGPAGLNDQYLQVVSGSYGGGSRFTVFNRAQWLGDYLAAGVTGISMELLNLGPSSLPIRIAIREGTGTASTPGYASTVPFSLPADGQWHAAFFSLDAGSLTPIHSPKPLAVDLANVADFHILSSSSPNTIGDFVDAKMGVDNILAVPEPGLTAMLVTGVLFLGLMRRTHLA